MSKYLMFSLAFLVSVVTAGQVMAVGITEEAVEHVEHYHADKPKDEKAAKALLKEEIETVSTLTKAQKLTDNDLEAIHKASYGLEASVESLREHSKIEEEKLDALDEAVQALHASSEKHKEAEVRKWFATLQTAAKAVQ